MQLFSVVLLCVVVGVVSGGPSGREVGELRDNELLERDTRQAGACDCRLTVYDQPNYRGRSLLILQQNADFSNDDFDNRVESVIVSGSCNWILYEHPNFNRGGGSTHIVHPRTYSSHASWGGPGNHISSARALPPAGTTAIALFEHHFTGRMVVLYGSHSRLLYSDFDNVVTSVIVIGGRWRLYEHPYFRGRYTDLTVGEYPYSQFRSFGGDILSSVKLL